MAHLGSSVEYGLHCLLWLVDPMAGPASSRDLAELQGVSPSFIAKIFPRLEKAGIVEASEGVRGGYRLARPANEITVLDVVDAIEGKKPLFDCQGNSRPMHALQRKSVGLGDRRRLRDPCGDAARGTEHARRTRTHHHGRARCNS